MNITGMARTEIGQDLIQGADMAYTLQGWMRGMNSARLETAYDPGKDAVSGNRHGRYGQDAFAYSLGYFHVPNTNVQDYHSIGQSGFSSDNFLIDQLTAGDYYNSYKDLYNGNISHMTVNMLDENGNNRSKIAGKGYEYDQLNRLREVRQFDQYNASGWQANQAGNNEAYRESFTFDKNGNIETLLRNGSAALEQMDHLDYQYNGVNNQLKWLDDAEAAGNYSEDLDDQGNNNYTYDAIGQLIGDVAEGTTVEWDAFNKVVHVDKNVALGNPTDIYFYYDGMGHRFAKKSVSNNPIQTIWTLYQRDASGNVISTYEVEETAGQLAFVQDELHLHGSDRLGILKPGRNMGTMSQNTQTLVWSQSVAPTAISATHFTRVVGMKEYELKNHLGNVMSVVSDRKTYVSGGSFTGFSPEVRSYQDYYAFGSLQPGRNYSSAGYRYGFNGKENDNEVHATGGWQDYGMRMYDPRLCRFPNVDPITKNYPMLTPYQFASNTPIQAIDLDGLEAVYPQKDKYKSTVQIINEFYLLMVLNFRTDITVSHVFKGVETKVSWSSENEFTLSFPYLWDLPLANDISTTISGIGYNNSTVSPLNQFEDYIAPKIFDSGSQNYQENKKADMAAGFGKVFRHQLWQAMLTEKFSYNLAKRVGDYQETAHIVRNDKGASDSYRDLINNEYGRQIAEKFDGDIFDINDLTDLVNRVADNVIESFPELKSKINDSRGQHVPVFNATDPAVIKLHEKMKMPVR